MNILVLLSVVVVALPLVAFLLLSISNKYTFLPWISIAFQVLTLAASVFIFQNIFGNEPVYQSFDWLILAEGISFSFGFYLDDHSVLMLLVVQLVSLMVHIYSLVYFEHQPSRNRFFAFLGLFICAMNGLVLADNLLMLFVFWELVGFASYLLIGFWYGKPSASAAAKKAFIINRFADLGLLAAMMIFWSAYDTLNVHQLKHVVFHFHESFILLHIAGFGLFLGCMGKSGQFPFQIWLPNAMEGPTPVSALIHAATMVAAGVYLLVKMAFLLTPDVLQTIAIFGSFTAFIGAFFAITQRDLKRVLAFSTISQLGFMMAGIGVGGTEASFFHLVTHAFFKACLFLCAGSVIHALKHASDNLPLQNQFDTQDISNMGGLRKFMPFTFAAFMISGFALAGIPLFSGFLSKDAILVAAFSQALEVKDVLHWMVFALLIVTPCFTSYYIFKLLYNVFGGSLKIESLLTSFNIKIHEGKALLIIPLVVLALFSIAFVFSINPMDFENSWVMKELITNPDLYSQNHLLIALVSLATIGVGLAVFLLSNKRPSTDFQSSTVAKLSFNQLYMNEIAQIVFVKPTLLFSERIANFDTQIIDRSVNLIAVSQVVMANIIFWIDKTMIDGFVNGLGWVSRICGQLLSKAQNGKVQLYFFYTLLVLVLLLIYLFIVH